MVTLLTVTYHLHAEGPVRYLSNHTKLNEPDHLTGHLPYMTDCSLYGLLSRLEKLRL